MLHSPPSWKSAWPPSSRSDVVCSSRSVSWRARSRAGTPLTNGLPRTRTGASRTARLSALSNWTCRIYSAHRTKEWRVPIPSTSTRRRSACWSTSTAAGRPDTPLSCRERTALASRRFSPTRRKAISTYAHMHLLRSRQERCTRSRRVGTSRCCASTA